MSLTDKHGQIRVGTHQVLKPSAGVRASPLSRLLAGSALRRTVKTVADTTHCIVACQARALSIIRRSTGRLLIYECAARPLIMSVSSMLSVILGMECKALAIVCLATGRVRF